MNEKSPLTRRKALKLGLGIVGGLEVAPSLSWADILDDNVVPATDEMATGVKKTGKMRIGFSNGFSGNTWRTECLQEMKNEAARNSDDYELIVVDGQGDITKQVNDIQDLIAQQVDAIVLIANSGTAVVPALRQAEKAGIITVPFNLPVDGKHWTAYLGTDPVQKGKILGRDLNTMLGGKGKIVGFDGFAGNSYSAGVWAGAKPELGDDIEMLVLKDADWQEDKAKIIMADLLVAHPQIDGIYSDGAQMSVGALKAMQSANRRLVPVTGDDYNGLLKFYHAEKDANPGFAMSLVSEPSWEGVVALRTAMTLLRGGTVPKRQTVKPTIINGDNYLDYMKPDLPDGVFVDTTLTDEELKELFS